MKTKLSSYAAHTRKQAFEQARNNLDLARAYKLMSDYGAVYKAMQYVKFWRNEAAYYIRMPA